MLEIKIYMWKGGMSMMARWLLFLLCSLYSFSVETRIAFLSLSLSFQGLDDVLSNKMIIFSIAFALCLI